MMSVNLGSSFGKKSGKKSNIAMEMEYDENN